jgi:hypothetical protein
MVFIWQDWLETHQIRQAFKQAYREIYLEDLLISLGFIVKICNNCRNKAYLKYKALQWFQ